jgi:hypothetical protein
MTNLTILHDITTNTKDGAMELAMDFATRDADFCGENGPGYLWKEAEGFECNAEYAWSVAEKEATPQEMLEKFFSIWLDSDAHYTDYESNVIVYGDKLSVALAFVMD